MRTSMQESKAAREAESANYINKLKGYTADLARFKQQYSERVVVSDGRPAVSDSGNAGSVRSELPDEAAMEPGSDGGPEEVGVGLDVEAAPSGVQADFPGRP